MIKQKRQTRIVGDYSRTEDDAPGFNSYPGRRHPNTKAAPEPVRKVNIDDDINMRRYDGKIERDKGQKLENFKQKKK